MGVNDFRMILNEKDEFFGIIMENQLEVKTMVNVRLWECRDANGITLRELERRSGISKSALQRIESGKTSPTLDQLDRIAIALNVNITYLYEWNKETNKNVPISGHFL